ncbi:hypothetical protein [Streptomyces alfalfae]|uniref:Uncharacterized protein n=1 Tax=Streptomyces alfalfae TaxID=1642299 RepID=A0A7T4PFE6_9ACTN|nr:hypothetical protein [Streptomyces alfalfae]QQC89034.1 hypothetical protein I8755_11845 [Streptomyces alfalfae]
MTLTEFGHVSFFWGWWTFFEAVWIAVLWQSRSRVLGAGVYRLPGVRRVGRGACERRVAALLEELERQGVPAQAWPARHELVDRRDRIAAGRFVSVLLQAVPLLIAVLPFAASPARTTVTPLWMCAAVAGFSVISMALMAADMRAVTVSDAAGTVTEEAVRFLELLLVPDGRRVQDSALDNHARVFGHLCQALRGQARYTARRMPPAARERLRQTTERLIAALVDADQRYLFGEGSDRDTAVRDLSLLVAGALRHSCRPRGQRDSLLVIDAALLVDAPAPDAAATATEPLRSRLLAGAGKVAVAVGLLAGAVLFPGGGAAAELLAAAGLASVALVCPPLRETLHRARDLLTGGPSTGDSGTAVTEEEQSRSASVPPDPCPRCAGHSPVTAGARLEG